jgi:plasmid maintenance system antidote protein VapI
MNNYPILKTLKHAIASQKIEFGVSQWQIAGRLEIPENRLSRILNGDRTPTDDEILKITKYFEQPAEKLLPELFAAKK